MISSAVAIGLAVAGLAWLVAGVAVIIQTRLRGVGGWLFLAGALGVAAAYPMRADRDAALLILLGSVMALCMALVCFPRLQRDLATFLAIAAVLAGDPLLAWRSAASSGGLQIGDLGTWIIVGLVATCALLWWRLETAESEDRRRFIWVLVAAAVVILADLVLLFVGAPGWLAGIGLALLGAVGWAVWIAAARPEFVDVRGVVAAAVVFVVGVLIVFTCAQLLTVALAQLTGHSSTAPEIGLVAIVSALIWRPVRRVLRFVTDEVLFGVRPDPLAAAGKLAGGVGEDPASALDALRIALVLPYAELRAEGLSLATSGQPVGHSAVVPLRLNHRAVGELVVGLRAGDFALSLDDARVLTLVAPLLAQSLRARALAESLQAARELAAEAREQERRRLRRDLHDGLGPRLSGIAFTADAARLAAGDPAELTTHLERVRAESVMAIREIRELVYGLRPPALDEVGLVEAIRLQAANLSGLHAEVEACELPPLPAAVEVAAYRIVMEALTNSARHSGSGRAWARLDIDGSRLRVIVRDGGDGGNGSGDWTPGVGLSSMRERTAELGGTLAIEGSIVTAELPL